VITSSGCCAAMAPEGRPARPAGTSVSSTTFLFALSRLRASHCSIQTSLDRWRVRVHSSVRAGSYGTHVAHPRWAFRSPPPPRLPVPPGDTLERRARGASALVRDVSRVVSARLGPCFRVGRLGFDDAHHEEGGVEGLHAEEGGQRSS
jgi:hypothetical protein